MSVRMISTRACYVPSSRREFEPNQQFDAADEREANRLTRQKRAKRVVVEETKIATPVAATPARRKVLSLKDDTTSSSAERTLSTASGSYARRDMRAEDE